MGYFKVGKFKIFYSDDRFVEVNQPFFKNLSAHEIVMMKVAGLDGKPSSNLKKLQKLQSDKLNEDLKKLSKNIFIEKWVEFEFVGERVLDVAWEVIYDYFDIHKTGRIKEIRNFESQVYDQFDGKDIVSPQGEIIVLEFILNSDRSFLEWLFFKKPKLIAFLNLSHIEKIRGTLTDMEIHTKTQIFKLGQSVEFINRV